MSSLAGHPSRDRPEQSEVTQLPFSAPFPRGVTLNGNVYPSTWLRLYQVPAAVPRCANVASNFESTGGAQPFADRCATELAACGAQPSVSAQDRQGADAFPVLSPRERRIAYLAAQGLTNQEIAGEVFVSAKTVEYHLSNVFAKLGISSRRQLSARLGGEPGG